MTARDTSEYQFVDGLLGGYVSQISKEMMHENGRISAEDAEMQIW